MTRTFVGFCVFSEMLRFILVSICGIFFAALIFAANIDDYKSIYIKAFRCNASEKFVYKNYSCYAKSYSRNYSTANAYGVAKFPLYNITESVQFFLNFFMKPSFSTFFCRAMRYCTTSTGLFIVKFCEVPSSMCAISWNGWQALKLHQELSFPLWSECSKQVPQAWYMNVPML